MDVFEGRGGENFRRALTVGAWLLVAFLAVEVVSVASGLRYVGAGIAATNTISVTGHGEVFETPDIAEFTYSVTADKSTVADAQAAATQTSNTITAYLKAQGVADADIQTSGYSVYPQYAYQNAVCPQPLDVNSPSGVSSAPAMYCPPNKQTLTGYEASQTTTVKVRDLTKAGDLLAGVGSKGATNISGLQFTFNDPNAPQNDARTKAIDDAKQKAQTLASELGVSLVRVTSFSENANGGYPRPMAYNASAGSATQTSAPEISPGQNDITDDVTITYEIK